MRLACWLRAAAADVKAAVSKNAVKEVLSSSVDRKQILVLNRPKALNALNLSMVRTIYPMLKDWHRNGMASMVILKGVGDKAFCAGGDVVAVTKSAQAKDPNMNVHKEFFREEYYLNHLIGICGMPFVALIDGITMGGGCGLSINGRFRVATERTMLAMPETALGLFPDVGGSFFLSRLPRHLGIFLALTGYRLQGADVYYSGLATHYVRSSMMKALEEALLKMKDEDVSVERVEDLLTSFHDFELPNFSLDPYLDEIEEIFGSPSVEQIFEKLKKSETDFAKKQLAILQKMSPTSMKVTFEQLKRGEKMGFGKSFTMEYRLSQHFMAGHDFHEGCRAILIDKDRKPKWKPATLDELSDKAVNSYFAPLPQGEDIDVRAQNAK